MAGRDLEFIKIVTADCFWTQCCCPLWLVCTASVGRKAFCKPIDRLVIFVVAVTLIGNVIAVSLCGNVMVCE